METFAKMASNLLLISFIICLHTTCTLAVDSTVLTVTLPTDFTTDLSPTSNTSTVDGGWSDWGAWHTCTQSCEGGYTVRFRRCNNPAPSNGGANCTGLAMEQGACNTDPCPVDGGWSSYSDWGACSVTCGGGNQTKTRTCSNPAPAYGGANCTGEDVQVQPCGDGICPTHGGWSNWGSYSLCNTDCEKTRYRTCTNPAPQDGGDDCPGSEVDVSFCSVLDCPVNGQWSEWTALSCDETCRGQKRRTCSNPPPLRGGADCVGSAREEYGVCTGFKCVQNGAWSDWSPWSACSKTCDRGGKSHRRRHCNNPHPRNGGKDCPALDIDYEEKSCFSHPCPVPPDYVRHVKMKKYNINWALILSIVFGILGVFTISLIVGLCFRQRQLKRKRKELLEEREKDKLYKEAAEMSIIPEGKKSAAEKLRRQQLKAKLKKNGKFDETEGLLDGEEDFGLLDEYWKTRSDTDSMGSLSRSGSLRSRSGSMRSKSGSSIDIRPGTATDRPGSGMERRPGSAVAVDRPGSALEAGPDSSPRAPNWNPDATPWEAPEDTLIKIDGDDAQPLVPEEQKKRRMRRRKRRNGNILRVNAVIEQHQEPFDLAQDAGDENRVATPDMMQQLMQLDAQLKEMAGHQESQNTGGVTGGIVPTAFTGLTDILGAPLTDVMQGNNMVSPPVTNKQEKTSGNVGMSLGQAMNGKTAQQPVGPLAAPHGGKTQHTMAGKDVGAANRQQGSAAVGGMGLQQAMGGKGAKQATPISQQPQQPQAVGGITMHQATGGKGAAKQANDKPAGGISLHDAFNSKSSGKPHQAQQPAQPQQLQQQQQQQRGGMTMEQATAGKPATRPRSSSRDGILVNRGLKTAARPRSSPQGSVTIEQETGGKGVALPRTPQRGGMTMEQATGGKQISPRGGAGFTSSFQAPAVKEGWAKSGSITLQQAMGPKIAPPTGVSKSRSYDSIIREAMGANYGQPAVPKKPRRASINVMGMTRERSDLTQFNKHFGELPKDDIELDQEIAEGAYGSIHRAGVWLPGQKEDEEPTSVLIKVLNRNVSTTSKAAYVKEIETMKKLKAHPNIIAFVGCCTKSDPYFMILEYASKGPLQTFLRRNRPGTPGAKPPPAEIFLRFAIHTAKGMTFLQSQRVAHGELTSRNILLNDYLRAKVSNSYRIRTPNDIIAQCRMGVRWMSPEVLAGGSYTPESDVWAFGVLLWELVCFGATPYSGMSSRDVKARIPTGHRLEQPPHCPDEIYEIMKSCWQKDSNQRPSFRMLVHELEKLAPQDFIDVSRFVPTRYEYM